MVTFVCRILKECSRSQIFKVQNPWINAILSIQREIYDYSHANNIANQQGEILLEIEALYKALGISNLNDVQPTGILKAV